MGWLSIALWFHLTWFLRPAEVPLATDHRHQNRLQQQLGHGLQHGPWQHLRLWQHPGCIWREWPLRWNGWSSHNPVVTQPPLRPQVTVSTLGCYVTITGSVGSRLRLSWTVDPSAVLRSSWVCMSPLAAVAAQPGYTNLTLLLGCLHGF